MPEKSSKNPAEERWIQLVDSCKQTIPSLASWWGKEEEFNRLQVMARDDGTMLAIAKSFGSDGGPMVAFGSGYGVVGALVALDRTIQGGHWKIDEPWEPSVS